MAEIAARSGKGFGELRWLDLSRCLKEESCKNKSFKKAEIVGRKNVRGKCLEAAGSAVDGEHGAFAEKGVDAHHKAALAELAVLTELV